MQDMDTRNYIAQKLVDFRERSGMTVAEVARKVGKSKQTISSWETCRTTPSASDLMAMCRVYEVDIRDFYPVEKMELDTEEYRLVANFRELDAEDAAEIQRIVAYVAERSRARRTEGGGGAKNDERRGERR